MVLKLKCLKKYWLLALIFITMQIVSMNKNTSPQIYHSTMFKGKLLH